MIPNRLLSATTAGLLALCLAFSFRSGQQQPATQPAPPASQPAGLPQGWLGRWHGDVNVVAPGGQVAGTFQMTLEIAAAPDKGSPSLPVYTWAITYIRGDTKQTLPLPYLLRMATSEAGAVLPGHFVLDQQNGILVDQFLVGQTMQGHFIVNSSGRLQILHARYELVTDEAGNPAMEVEIASYDGNESRRSTVNEGGVESRRLLRVQQGSLKKQP
jgi:hypothetical protein